MRVHLIGIAGTAMTSLARLLRELGHSVAGSDANIYPPMSTELESMGIPVAAGYRAENLEPTPDLVVVGNAIPRGNEELEACLDRGLAYTSQAEAIEDLVLPGRRPIVVAGTHGKTTTTSLISWVLSTAGRDPGWFIGGVPYDLEASAALGTGDEIVLEGDEYDTAYFDKRPKFHHYRPQVLVINNLEFDHADIYPDLESIKQEFRRLVNTVPRTGLVIVGSDSAAATEVVTRAHCPVVSFGLGADAELRATDIVESADGTSFRVHHGDLELGTLSLLTIGHHNVNNSLAALAVARHMELPFEGFVKALSGFRGVRRRLDAIGTFSGVTLFDDFAHHPTAIRETLTALKRRGLSGRLWALVEPRSWSMRRSVHQGTLPHALATADVVVMTPVHQFDRVPPGEALDVPAVIAEITAAGREAHAVASTAELLGLVTSSIRSGDVVVAMSNGGFDAVPQRLADALRRLDT